MTFKVGDVVLLKSGGPEMTVTRLSNIGEETIHTSWFGGRKLEHGGFPAAALVVAKEKASKP